METKKEAIQIIPSEGDGYTLKLSAELEVIFEKAHMLNCRDLANRFNNQIGVIGNESINGTDFFCHGVEMPLTAIKEIRRLILKEEMESCDFCGKSAFILVGTIEEGAHFKCVECFGGQSVTNNKEEFTPLWRSTIKK